jgi:hypothetical protein
MLTNLDTIREDIIAACQAAKAQGVRVIAGHWDSPHKGCCPLTAVVRDQVPPKKDGRRMTVEIIRAIEQRYGLTPRQILSLVRGIDEHPGATDEPELWLLGRDVRRAVIE